MERCSCGRPADHVKAETEMSVKQLKHRLLLTLKDVAEGHYTPEDAQQIILTDFAGVFGRRFEL